MVKQTENEVLQSLVADCLKVATEIKTVVDNLEDKGKGTWEIVEGLRKTGYLIYKGKDLQRLSERLSELRLEVSAHLIVLIEWVLMVFFKVAKVSLITGKTITTEYSSNFNFFLCLEHGLSGAIWQAVGQITKLSQEHFEAH